MRRRNFDHFNSILQLFLDFLLQNCFPSSCYPVKLKKLFFTLISDKFKLSQLHTVFSTGESAPKGHDVAGPQVRMRHRWFLDCNAWEKKVKFCQSETTKSWGLKIFELRSFLSSTGPTETKKQYQEHLMLSFRNK